MDADRIVRRLEHLPAALPPIIGALGDAELRWRPPSGNWSVLEVLAHMADEEVDDFRARLRHVLEGRAGEWAPIDPVGWARDRRYNEADPASVMDRLLRERRASVAWLRAQARPDWSRAYQHPRFGPIAAGDLLASWAAHDALHLRQIAKRLWELAGRDAGAFAVRYAGDWAA